MKLDPNDKIVGVKICTDDQDIILSTKLGKSIRCESKKLRIFKGRSSKGIRGINLSDNDEIVSLSIIDNNSNKKNQKLSKTDKVVVIGKTTWDVIKGKKALKAIWKEDSLTESTEMHNDELVKILEGKNLYYQLQ